MHACHIKKKEFFYSIIIITNITPYYYVLEIKIKLSEPFLKFLLERKRKKEKGE